MRHIYLCEGFDLCVARFLGSYRIESGTKPEPPLHVKDLYAGVLVLHSDVDVLGSR